MHAGSPADSEEMMVGGRSDPAWRLSGQVSKGERGTREAVTWTLG